MKNVSFLLIAIIGLLFVVFFILQNTSEIIINFLFWEIKSTVSVVFFTAFLIGVLTTLVSLLPSILRKEKGIENEEF